MCILFSRFAVRFASHLPTARFWAKNETPKTKKFKKIFYIKNKSPPAKKPMGRNEIHYSDVLKAKKDLQLFSRRSGSDLGVLSVIGGDLHIFHPRNGEQMGRIGECFGESPTRISPKITLLQAIANYSVQRLHCREYIYSFFVSLH